MGKVLIIAKLYPEEVEDVAKIEAALKEFKEGRVQDVRREPVAFGLELVRVGVLVPDKEDGVADKVENALKKLSGVNQVEIEGATLV